MIVDSRPSIYEGAYMDDFITGLLVGVFGEELFRKIARKRYFVPAFFAFLLLAVQLLIALITLFISLPSLFDGYYSDKPTSVFFIDFIGGVIFESQPYALLFSAVIALLGTISYLWHRNYSNHHSDKDSGDT